MIFSFALLPFIASMNCRDDAASKDPHQVLHPIGGKNYGGVISMCAVGFHSQFFSS